jgi:hypothetical protein
MYVYTFLICPCNAASYCVRQAVGPQGLYDAIEDADDVSRVALGPHDTWLVLYKDGSQVSGLITIGRMAI